MFAQKAQSAAVGGFDLQVLHCAGQLLMAMVGPICVSLWQTKPTAELFAIQRAQLAAAVARNPGKVAFLCVVESSADPPDDAERNASAAMINEHGANLLGVAGVIESTGFRGAITRTVLSGIVLVIRSRVSIKMFESVRAASPWLARCVQLASLPELHEQVERGRALLTACTLRDRETARA
jgi:hypothetical protein